MMNHVIAQTTLAKRIAGVAAIEFLSESTATAQSAKEMEHQDSAKWQNLSD